MPCALCVDVNSVHWFPSSKLRKPTELTPPSHHNQQHTTVTNMKVLLATLALLAIVSAQSAAFEDGDSAAEYSSDYVERIKAIAGIFNAGTNDVDDRGLLSDINIIGNFIGGKKNRIDAINDFGGDFSGFGKRNLFDVTGSDDQQTTDRLFNVLFPQRARAAARVARMARAANMYSAVAKRFGASYDDFSLLRDLDVIGNFIGGKENRIDAINGYKGIGSGAF
ncbi:hypothetical protein PROFUN_09867 [Planoprotostelium fungivorum]|uniref:Uncharacterized protein n=1 Tax=Planoprotostelium fungivorum TaxID=1890364 RepID=A0A2P6NGF7_9EUKA|nr:hypothetical protein PROFUN_09867 [Planoprotostelium fungivorum]